MNCVKCAQRKTNLYDKTVEPCGKFIIPTKPFELVHMDIMCPFPRSSRNNLYALTMQDSFSKFAITTAIPSIITEVVIDRFLKCLVYTFGPPARLITDRRSNFMSSQFAKMCKDTGIIHEPTLPHQKNANGQIERLHRTLEECISHYVNQDLSNWDLFLPKITHTLNTVPSSTTGISPYVHCLEEIAACQLINLSPTHTNKNTAEHIEHSILDKVIYDKLRTASETNVQKYNTKHNVNEKDVKKNDFVMIAVKNLKPGHKLRKSFDGPFRVVNVNGSLVQVQNSNGKLQDVHKDSLKIYSRNLSNIPSRNTDVGARHQLNHWGKEKNWKSTQHPEDNNSDKDELKIIYDSKEDEILEEEDAKDPTYVPLNDI
ncbi:unnamed protein product [Auanema sp. JU1783]|nr:unnamed protein product [Auanema sp. JU1783]